MSKTGYRKHPAESAPFHSGVGCRVHIIQYDGVKKRGELHCGGTADPAGAMALFEAIDPGVEAVVTFNCNAPDSIITRKGRALDVRALDQRGAMA